MNPAFLALLLTPLIIGVKPVVFGTETIVDIYSWYKAAFLLVLGAIAFYQKRPPMWLVAAVALSCVASKWPDMAWWGFPGQYFGGAVFIALLALAANPPSEKNVIRALTWGSIPVSLLAAFPQLIPWSLIVSGYTPRFLGNPHAGTLDNVNYVGFYAAMVMPVLFTARRKFECTAAFLLLALALFRSGSLGGLIGVVCGCLFSAALEYPRRFFESVVPAGIVGACVVAYKWKPDFNGRLDIWRHTVPLLTWHGSGLATFPLDYPQTGPEYVDKPHSLYLQALHAFGVHATVIGAGLMSMRFITGDKPSLALTAGLVGGLVAGLANDLYIGVAPILFILFTASTKTQEN